MRGGVNGVRKENNPKSAGVWVQTPALTAADWLYCPFVRPESFARFINMFLQCPQADQEERTNELWSIEFVYFCRFTFSRWQNVLTFLRIGSQNFFSFFFFFDESRLLGGPFRRRAITPPPALWHLCQTVYENFPLNKSALSDRARGDTGASWPPSTCGFVLFPCSDPVERAGLAGGRAEREKRPHPWKLCGDSVAADWSFSPPTCSRDVFPATQILPSAWH